MTAQPSSGRATRPEPSGLVVPGSDHAASERIPDALLDAPRPERGSDGAGQAISEASEVVRAQDGDVEAFTRLVHRYEAELTRLAFRTVADRGDAQDVVQDVFTAAWRRLPTLADPQAFRAWIYQITTRTSLNFARRRTQARTDLTREGDDTSDFDAASDSRGDGAGPAAAAQASAQRRALDQVLATLPAEQRACWVLNDLHGLSYPEIAYATGVPVSTVRGRIARARQALATGMVAWR